MRRFLIGLALLAVLAGIAAVFTSPETWRRSQDFLERLDPGPRAALTLMGLQALMVVLALPGPFFTVATGYLFGNFLGGAIAVAGSTTGAALAYWIGRGLGPQGAPPRFLQSPRFVLLGRFLSQGGWQTVLATRLIPFFPFKLSNYFFGWSRFSFPAFYLGTLIGVIPLTMVSVSAGALASEIAGPSPSLRDEWIWPVVSLGAALAILGYSAYRFRGKGWGRDGDTRLEGGRGVA